MTLTLHRQPETEIYGADGGSITGTAVYNYTIEETFDRDIGGVDGPCVTACELLGIEIDNVMIPRNVIEQIIGRDRIVPLEDRASGAILLAQLEKDAA